MLIYGMACIPLRLSEKGCDQRNIARLKKMWGKLIEAACEPSNWNCLLEAKCDAPTISDANTDCYKTYNQEHGVNTRKPSDPLEPSGDVELLCCMLKYNKYCVPKLLEEKGCHPDAVLRSGTAIETRMKTTCPSSKPKCVPPPQCNDKTLSDARLICEQRYKEAHEPTVPKRRVDLQPRDQSLEEMHKEHCCVMEYSRDCVLGYLKEHGCSDPDFLESFLENIRTECEHPSGTVQSAKEKIWLRDFLRPTLTAMRGTDKNMVSLPENPQIWFPIRPDAVCCFTARTAFPFDS
ncbi:uncharacterized protein LOC135374089 [Ornithodoros turicata]|uniref:uncharacterized protein LOC135374089 n=1 Tax=Ornithodoros turicata TaxID=34597 RepID=UPI0031399D4C